MQRRGAGRKIPYGMISVIADTWMHELPAFGRLHCAVERVSGGMHITETRVATMLFQPPEWQGASEYAVYLLSIEIGVLRGRMNINAKRLAVVGLHALARRYERGSGKPMMRCYSILAPWRSTPSLMGSLPFRSQPGAGGSARHRTGRRVSARSSETLDSLRRLGAALRRS